jgi:ABC-2 type transport system permease protein
MTIREKGYYSWDGELKSTGIRWLPMFFYGIKTAFKKRFAKVVFSFTLSPFFIFLGALYVSTRPELKMMKELVRLLNNEAEFFNSFLTNGYSLFWLIVLAVFFGAELISRDIKTNSFPLYFSRPLDRKDYIFGKLSIILFYFLLFTLVPVVLLYIFKIIFTGDLGIDFRVLGASLILPILVAFYITSITLMISSFTGNTRYARIIVFLIYIFSTPFAQLLIEIFNSSYFYVFSIQENIRQMGAFLFNAGPKHNYPGWISLLVVILVSMGAYYILYKRIGKAEAQIESGN